jgi:hypothetical protein
MYRIRLASGAETTYQSMDEFVSALQGGEVTAEAVIYHQRADRWLSITNHPHYQIALSRVSSSVARPDASKRQVVSAVRPSGEVPATRVAPRPEVQPAAAQATKPKTTVLPIRSAGPYTAKPPVKTVEPVVPDLGAGLDLVEDVPETPVAKRPSTATPQVDKLLEMLEPAQPPVAATAAIHQLEPVELLDLSAPLPQALVQTHQPAPHHHPATVVSHNSHARSGKNTKILGLAAAAMVAIAAVMFAWKPWASALPEGTDIASTTLPRTEAFGGSTGSPAPTTAQISGSETANPAAAVDTAKTPAKPVDSAPAIVRVAAPRNLNIAVPTANLIASNGGSGLNISAGTLIQHYNEAYTDARSELELRMLQIGFTQIFLRSRLTTAAGVEDTRRLIASATSALRQYRNQETQIERSYQDTIGTGGRNLGWTPRDLGTWNMKQGQKESGETLRLTNLMLNQMDSTFSLLSEQEGKYSVSGESITFEDSEAARQYGALRSWLNQQADKYAGSGDALPATLRQVVKAMGASRLPQERR